MPSDAVSIALIGSFTGLATILLNHFLGRYDRLLADKTVSAKNDELNATKVAHAREIEELRVKYTSEVNALRGELTVCQSKLNAFMGDTP